LLEQDADPRTEPAVDTAAAEDALAVVAPHARDAPIAAVQRGRAKSNEVRQLGVSLLEFVLLVVRCRTVAIRSCSRALRETPNDLFLPLPVTTDVVEEECPLTRCPVHADARGVEIPLTAIEEGRDVVLAELLLENGEGRHRSVGDAHAIVVRWQCAAVRRTPIWVAALRLLYLGNNDDALGVLSSIRYT